MVGWTWAVHLQEDEYITSHEMVLEAFSESHGVVGDDLKLV